jgi:hypothetical protein
MSDQNKTFHPGTYIPRGKYIRQHDSGKYDCIHFAVKADEERTLRLMLDDPKNWFSSYFRKERDPEEIIELLNVLSFYLDRVGFDVTTLDNFIEEF